MIQLYLSAFCSLAVNAYRTVCTRVTCNTLHMDMDIPCAQTKTASRGESVCARLCAGAFVGQFAHVLEGAVVADGATVPAFATVRAG